jgi:hydrogenase-1 operon protein HyaF
MSDIEPRPNPMKWHDIEGPDVLAPGHDAPAGIGTFDLPKSITPFAKAFLTDLDPAIGEAVRAELRRAREALLAAAAGAGGAIIQLAAVAEPALAALDDALGEGEVTISISGAIEYRIRETLFPGLWHVETLDAAGRCLDRQFEVAGVPLVVETAARELTAAKFIMPDPIRHISRDLMNIMPLLFEIDARMADVRPGVTNHVISLTNLPMTDDDLALLGETIGGGEIKAFSKGYGATRITSTRARGVWQVEYLNSMGLVILDTIEIGGPPAALLAAREDFEDSAERIAELIESI